MVKTFQPHIRNAKSIVAEELCIIRTEYDAFRQFLNRLDQIETQTEVTQYPLTPQVNETITRSEQTNPNAVAEVMTAYSETVMAVPHYSEEYGDSITESLVTEFGIPVMRYLIENDDLTGQTLDIVAEKVRDSIDMRSNFINSLQEEQDSLERSEARINDIERRAIEIRNDINESNEVNYEILKSLQTECESVASERQSLVHNRSIRTMSGVDEESLLGYLYSEMDVWCPVLADVSECRQKTKSICDNNID
jgi:hypothetical protein